MFYNCKEVMRIFVFTTKRHAENLIFGKYEVRCLVPSNKNSTTLCMTEL